MERPLSNSVYPAHSDRNMNEVLMHVYGDTLKTKRQGREHTTTNNKKQCNETDNLLPPLPVSDAPHSEGEREDKNNEPKGRQDVKCLKNFKCC